MNIKQPLNRLLDNLESITADHEEIFDTDVREELSTAIYCAFITSENGYQTPDSFEMFSDEGNAAVKSAVDSFLRDSCPIAESLGWSEQQRQDAFQDLNVTSKGGLTYDEFFGHAD